jgi:hypothetical protein
MRNNLKRFSEIADGHVPKVSHATISQLEDRLDRIVLLLVYFL